MITRYWRRYRGLPSKTGIIADKAGSYLVRKFDHGGKIIDTYTDPTLRDKLKEEIKAGDKGGKPGEWSARKSQLLASEYKKAGGGYKKDERTPAQEHLEEWTEQDWRTEDGTPAKRGDKTARYLPADAWAKLTSEQRKATNAKKLKASAERQYVENTKAAQKARHESDKETHKKHADK